ncbi:MAG: hypothetical protein NXH88_05135 [Hyphomonas sp.]|nr:hypothetical protein [Hyphomonas sp.]
MSPLTLLLLLGVLAALQVLLTVAGWLARLLCLLTLGLLMIVLVRQMLS